MEKTSTGWQGPQAKEDFPGKIKQVRPNNEAEAEQYKLTDWRSRLESVLYVMFVQISFADRLHWQWAARDETMDDSLCCVRVFGHLYIHKHNEQTEQLRP